MSIKKNNNNLTALAKRSTALRLYGSKAGFTALEMLIAVAIIVILLGIVVISLRDQGPKNRDAERKNEVNAIADALATWSFDNNTPFGAISPVLPSSANCIGTKTASPACNDLTSFLVPQYLNNIPEDPKNANGQADTGYTIYKDAATKEIIIGAPNTENGDPIEARRK